MTTATTGFNSNRRKVLKVATGAAIALATPVAFPGAPPVFVGQDGFDPGRIKLLAFDFQGSVVDAYTPINEMGLALNASKGLSLDWAVLTKAWTDNFIKGIGVHRDNYVSVAQIYREALDLLLEQLRLSEHFSVGERTEMTSVWNRMVPWADTGEGLSRLKRQYALTTLSNASMASVFQIVHRHALPFDQVLTGELVRAYKPAPKVYELVTSLLGYKAEEVLYCATHFADLSGAKKQGYRTAWWPRPLENGPGHVIDTAPKPFVDLYVADINDLAAKMGT